MTFKNDLNLFLLSFGRQIFEMSIQNVTEKAKAFLLAKNIDFDESTILMALAEAKRMIPEPESVTETRKHLKIYLKAFEKQILKVKIENLMEWSTNYLKEKKLLSFAWENWFWGEMYLYIAEAKKNADSKDGWCELAKDKTEDDDILTKSDGMIELNELDDKLRSQDPCDGFVLLKEDEDIHFDHIYEENHYSIVNMIDTYFAQRGIGRTVTPGTRC